MRCVVTGGAGFIGSHLTEMLLHAGHTVVVIDNCVTGRWSNLQQFLNSPQLICHECDVATLKPESEFFDGADWVFHLAALADIVPSIERPIDYIRTNVNGTMAVLEASRRVKVKRFVYAASSSCYGIPEQYPTRETSEIQPQYPYALSKYLGEECVLHWGKVYKMPVVSLRFFNVYGPRARTSGTYGAVLGVFLAQKLAGQPFTIVGDGKQSRDFTYVTDVADALFTAARSDSSGEVFNVGSGEPHSVNDLVKLLGGPVTYIPKRPGEPDMTWADISKIQKLLHWKPKVSFSEGVQSVLNVIDYWKDAPVWSPEKIQKATEGWFKYLSPSGEKIV
ncbi:MAG: NAD-dependent dehydratase [Deltaproteobacteria bacterium CG11_big_fil_rev_8_21_14_0_20_47_16]|nr:MAG: NAD-dependent dehydratase [Deltaproteobacteria bacterium CG11_big_fil_rev_8_21_14_0_20_47_16]